MGRFLDYLGDWKRLVREGLRSYLEVSDRLREGRKYPRHYYTDTDDGYIPGVRIEVPLLWGSF